MGGDHLLLQPPAGKEYVTSQPYNLERSFADARPGTPIFVFLSPGVDVAGSVEALGRKLGFTQEAGNYHSVSLGQGQVRCVVGAAAQAGILHCRSPALVCIWASDGVLQWGQPSSLLQPVHRVQEGIAMTHLTHAHKNGGWVLLQNIHLTIDWTSGPLEKRIDKLADGAHPDFR